MNLDIAWSAPSPVPNCGYKAIYRRRSDPTYTELDTSGTTLVIAVEAPASYEGKLISDCCSESVSSGVAFGVNAYSLVSASAELTNQQLFVTVESDYANPYDTLVEGNVNIVLNNNPTVVPFSVTYAAGNITQTFNIGIQQGTSVTSTDITSLSPFFNNGGELQQLDPISTPPYFRYYFDGEISGNTWNGSPASLPSFTLDMFTPTELAVDGITVLAGQLNFSYILGEMFATSFTSFTIEVYDPSSHALMGSVIISTSPLGIRTESITINKSVSPLDTSTRFIMRVLWPDDTIFDTKRFYLPS